MPETFFFQMKKESFGHSILETFPYVRSSKVSKTTTCLGMSCQVFSRVSKNNNDTLFFCANGCVHLGPRTCQCPVETLLLFVNDQLLFGSLPPRFRWDHGQICFCWNILQVLVWVWDLFIAFHTFLLLGTLGLIL